MDSMSQEEAERLALYHKIPGLLLVIDQADQILAVSDRWLRTFGYTRAEVVGQRAATFLPECAHLLSQLVYTPGFYEQGYIEEIECQFVKKSGEVLDVLLSAAPEQSENGAAAHILVALRDITRRKRMERLLRAVSEGTAAVTGERFFRALVSHLSQALGAPYVFITECTDYTAPRVRTLASIEHHVFVESAEWNVRGTTCEMVFQGSVTYYPDQLGQLYPEYLNKRQSYLGAPLRASDGAIIGHLAIFDIKPTRYDPQEIAIIQIFAVRAGVELERQITERARRKGQEDLRQLNVQLEDYNRHLEEMVQQRTQELERRNRVAESLHDMVMILNSARPLTEILDYIVTAAAHLLGAQGCALYKLEPDGKSLVVQATHGLPAAYVDQLKLSVEQSFMGQAIVRRQPLVIANIASAIAIQPTGQDVQRRAFLAENFQTLLSVPLIRQGNSGRSDDLQGGIALYYAMEHPFDEEEIQLAMAFGAQAALTIENARLHQQVEQMAVMNERGRLARELHDSVTQLLYSLTLLSEGWRRIARAGQLKQIDEPLAELGQLGQQALKEMRLLIYELRPPNLETEGLLGALHQRLNAVEQRAGIEARLLTDEMLELPPAVEDCLYRIAQEALNNILKHAQATQVQVDLHATADGVILEIFDNGKGFETEPSLRSGGIGLSSMRERAERIGGVMQIFSTPGSGTKIQVKVPLR